MTLNSIRKRLDALEKRRTNLGTFVLLLHSGPVAEGEHYRKPGESIDECLARYGVDPKRRNCMILDMTGEG